MASLDPRRSDSVAGLVCGVDIGGTFTDCVLIGEDGKGRFWRGLPRSSEDREPTGLLEASWPRKAAGGRA